MSSFSLKEVISRLELSSGLDVPSFISAAAGEMGVEDPLHLGISALYTAMDFKVRAPKGRTDATVRFVPGHRLDGNYRGPNPDDARIMILVDGPSSYDSDRRTYLSGRAGALLREMLESVGVKPSECYITGVCKFAAPGGRKAEHKAWHYNISKWFLRQEIRIVKPKMILVLGSKAVKAIFPGEKLSSLAGMAGVQYWGIPAFVAGDPCACLFEPGNIPMLRANLREFKASLDPDSRKADPVDYRYLWKIEEFRAIVDEWLENPIQEPWMPDGQFVLSVDCEWGGGRKAIDPYFSKLRMVQLSRKEKTAIVLHIRGPGLVEYPGMPEAEVAVELNRLFSHPGACLAGHNLKSDARMLEHIGVNCTPGMQRGFDTSLMRHIVLSTADFGLESVVLEYLDMGRYDRELEAWKRKNPSLHGGSLGYSMVPDGILGYYGACDVDAVIRLIPLLMAELRGEAVAKPYEILGQRVDTLYDLYRVIEHGAIIPLHELEKEGIPVDRERLVNLADLFREKLTEKTREFQEMIRWPEFNHRSYIHVRELLFGWKDTVTLIALQEGRSVKMEAPDDAVCFGLSPVTTTEKPSRNWDSVPPAELPYVAPSTGYESLCIMASKDDRVKHLSDIRALDQILKSFLRDSDTPEEADPEVGGGPSESDDEDEEMSESSGLIPSIDPDGKIRTSIVPLTDTGRHRSSKPNLQNLPKKTEHVYRRLFATDTKKLLEYPGWKKAPIQELKDAGLIDRRYFTLRSALMADAGHVLVESDYSSAELFVLAGMSGDRGLWDIMHDKSRDMHSEIATLGFNLPCSLAQAKEYVKKYEDQKRDAAKAVVYGILYGRGAEAVVRAMQKDGIYGFTVKDAERLQEVLLGTFPKVREYIEYCHARVVEPGYVENAFGRRRYFAYTDDRAVRAKQMRQSVNAPIQGTVADVLSVAMIAFRTYKLHINPAMRFKMVLPVHDQLDFVVHPDDVDVFTKEVIPLCMCQVPKVPHIGLTLQNETDVRIRMADKMSREDAVAFARQYWNKNVA